MIPVRQTQFVATHPKGRGNCQSACLASILELPLDQVIDTASDECHGRHWGDWWDNIRSWLADQGFKMVVVSPGDDRLYGAYSIGSGPSPRGPFKHAVVCRDGEMVFDPHFSDLGVTKLERHELIVPLTEAEFHLWHLAKRKNAMNNPIFSVD